MRRNSLAFRLFVSAAAWTLLVVPAAAILLFSLYRQAVERNFDARLNVYLTSLVASTTRRRTTGTTQGARQSRRAGVQHPLLRLVLADQAARRPSARSSSRTPSSTSSSSCRAKIGVAPDETLTRRAYAPGPEDQRLRIVEREIRPGGPNSTPLFLCGRRRRGRDRTRSRRVHHHADRRAWPCSGSASWWRRCSRCASASRRLRAIRHDLAAIRSGEAERLEGELPDEIRPLQQELNALIQSNREIVERARTHVGNLAHALKTPLSVITNEARDAGGPARRQGRRAGRADAHADHASSRPRAQVAARVERRSATSTDVDGRAQRAEADARPHL